MIIPAVAFALFGGSAELKSVEAGKSLMSIGKLDEVHQKNIEQAGFAVAVKEWKDIQWDTVRQFNVIIFPGDFYLAADFLRESPAYSEFQNKCAILRRFLEEGGGIFIMDGLANTWSRSLPANDFLKSFDAGILPEAVIEQGTNNIFVQSKFVRLPWALTTDIADSPVTRGVKSLLWPSQGQTYQYGTYTLALKVGPEWQVVVRASKTACSIPLPDSFSIDITRQPAGAYPSSPPLMAIREVGKKGRLALLDINQMYMTLDGYHLIWDGIAMSKGNGPVASDWEKVLLQTYSWLAAPSVQSGTPGGYVAKEEGKTQKAIPAPLNWEFKPAAAHNYRGLVGLHTTLSSGKGEVKDFVGAAKKAGCNWIIFTEDYEKMDQEKWQVLQNECKANSDSDFLAIPGLQFKDQPGNNIIVFGEMAFPSRKLWEPQRFNPCTYIYNTGHCGVMLFNIKANPFRPNNLGNWTSFGIYTYKDGKLMDDSLDEYLYVQRNTFRVCPFSVHLIYSPEEVASEAQNGFQTYILSDSIDKIVEKITGYPARSQSPYPVNVSSGPEILDCRLLNNWPNLALPGGERWRFRISVASPAGLKEIRVVDDLRQFYRFLPGGEKEFTREIEGFHDRQKMFVVIAEDVKGGKAISGLTMPHILDMFYINCTDNMNTMGGYMRTKEIVYKGKVIQPPNGYEFHMSSGFSMGGWFAPAMQMFTKEAMEKGVPPCDEEYVFASRDMFISDRFIRYLYPPGTPVGRARPSGDPKYVLKRTADYDMTLRTWCFSPYEVEGYDLTLVEAKVKFKKDFTLTQDALNPIYVIGQGVKEYVMEGDLTSFAYTQDRAWVARQVPVQKSFVETQPLPENGGMVVYPSFTGVSGIFALSKGLGFKVAADQGRVARVEIGAYNMKKEIKAGDEISYRLLGASGRGPDDDQLERFKWVGKSMGVTGAPAYTVNPRQGKVKDTVYILNLEAEDYGFSGSISQAVLPAPLPVVVAGLNGNWDSGIWNKTDNSVRRFGVLDEQGYLEIDLATGKKDLYLGNFLVCDHPEVQLLLLEGNDRKVVFQIHNPTDQDVSVRVQPAKGFNRVFPFSWEQQVGKGSMQIVTVTKQ